MDDFTKIKGIGAARAKALHEAGYKTFEDLKKAGDEELLKVLGDEEVVKNIREFFESGKVKFVVPVKIGKKWYQVGDEYDGKDADKFVKRGLAEKV